MEGGSGVAKTGSSGDRKRGKLMEMESLERRWSGAPLGDSSKSRTAAGGAEAAVLMCVCVCV